MQSSSCPVRRVAGQNRTLIFANSIDDLLLLLVTLPSRSCQPQHLHLQGVQQRGAAGRLPKTVVTGPGGGAHNWRYVLTPAGPSIAIDRLVCWRWFETKMEGKDEKIRGQLLHLGLGGRL